MALLKYSNRKPIAMSWDTKWKLGLTSQYVAAHSIQHTEITETEKKKCNHNSQYIDDQCA